MPKVEQKNGSYVPYYLEKPKPQKIAVNFFPVIDINPKTKYKNDRTPEIVKLKDAERTLDIRNIKTTEDVASVTGLREDFIEQLTESEGLKLDKYSDAGGKATIGYGHNIDADSTYAYGDHITEETAAGLLAKDLTKAQVDLDKLIDGQELKIGQKEALLDLVFNVGWEKIEKTKLLTLVKEGRFEEATQEFDFVKVNGQDHPHLCRRRIQNISSFCEENPSAAAVSSMENLQSRGLGAINKKIKKDDRFLGKLGWNYQKIVFSYQTSKIISKTAEKLEEQNAQ